MKCPSCHSLNMPGDAACAVCGSDLTRRPAAMPQWAYLFTFLCWGIPVASLGGGMWVIVASAGSSLCLVVARTRVLPTAVRMVLCFAITAGCWAAFAVTLGAVVSASRRPH